MVSTVVFILVCSSVAGLLGLCLWLWHGYRRACRLRVCHHCRHQLTKFAGGRMPWCPECGGLSGPRTRWKFVLNEVRRPRVVVTALVVGMGFALAAAAGPGASWATRAGVVGGGVLLWWCENTGGGDAVMIDALCRQDAATPLSGPDRRRLAKLILNNPSTLTRALGSEQERALTRMAASGVLSVEQASQYEWLVLKQAGLAYGSGPALSAPASSLKPQRAPVPRAWDVPVGIDVYDSAATARFRAPNLDPTLVTGIVSMPSTLAPPTKPAGEKAKKPAIPEKKDKDEKVTW